MIDTLDIKTLAICFGICSCLQCAVFFMQYRANKSEHGLGWWTLGSASMAFGFLLNYLRDIQSLRESVAILYNLSFVLGFSLFYLGICKFKQAKPNTTSASLVCMATLAAMLYFVFINDSIPMRRTTTSIACAIFSILSFVALTRKGDPPFDISSKFLKTLFCFDAVWLLVFSFLPLFDSLRIPAFTTPAPLKISYLFLLCTSTLLTFGLIMLVNKKLAEQLRTSKLFLESTLDGLSANIALLEEHGEIVLVNKAWRTFASDNGVAQEKVSEGTNYITVCEDSSCKCTDDAAAFSEGIKRVLHGKAASFTMEYACHSHDRQRWFLGRVTPFPGSGPKRVVVAHEDITERKLMEIELERTNRKLEMLTNEDALTKISNRRHFDNMLLYECNRHARSKAVLSLIMLDIDYFKYFNDTYGHVQGDACLQSVAQAVSQSLKRPTDLAARYGGEEFVCLLPETDLIGAVSVAESIRKSVQDLAIPHEKSEVSDTVTVSLGVLTLSCEQTTSPNEILRLVDELLYQAKNEGRNRVKFREICDESYITKGKDADGPLQIVWNASYISGNDEIDQQHMSLIHLANTTLKYIFSNDGSDIRPYITDILTLVEKHFEHEEKLLHEADYPEFEDHAVEHNRLLQKCSALIAKQQDSNIPTADILQYIIQDLVMQHMIKEDVKYHAYFSPNTPKAL